MSFHTAAILHSLQSGHQETARYLLGGLARRFDEIFDSLERGETPIHYSEKELTSFLIHGAAAGLPLTWREVRFLHDRIRATHAGFATRHGTRSIEASIATGPMADTR